MKIVSRVRLTLTTIVILKRHPFWAYLREKIKMRRYMFVLLLYMLPHLISKVTLSAVFVWDGESVKRSGQWVCAN